MNPLDTEFHRRLKKRLEEDLTSRIENLSSGALDHLNYMRVCGAIRAIRDVLDICKETESDMNQGK